MSLQKLRDALLEMPPTGEQGFEGLVATLLSTLTGDRFYVARSGDQPSDAITSASDIAIQAKRYDSTRFSETHFEGEFHRACRVFPKLDCYVFAASRNTVQLVSLANELQNREGVDIFLLEFEGRDSEVAALCVHFWNAIKHFPNLLALGPDFSEWTANEARRSAVVATVARLHAYLTTSVPLAGMVSRKLKAYLTGRFGVDLTLTGPVRFSIDLPASVPRPVPQQALVEWWTGGEGRAALLMGEEGMGKSVVAAAFANGMVQDGSALVLWLDSADWAGVASIESIVNAGLKYAGFSDRNSRERLGRKAITRWSSKILLVLDGVNEKSARETAHHILKELQAAEVPACRILFTSRPISRRSDESSLWSATKQIPVGPFTDEELGKALSVLTNPIPREELPNGLLDVARIPRYFKRAVQLRAQFKSLKHVSKEMVLWADLLEKIDAGDTQITEQIGWKSSADLKRALSSLALAAIAIQTSPSDSTDSYSVLQACFGNNFERTRLDLAEQRVLLNPTGDNPTPSREHVVLGFALHLGSLASKHADKSISDIADRLRAELEPVLSQDYLTEALFVALQLSVFPNPQAHVLFSKARSGLLFAWASSQNSRLERERFEFWANQDLPAYLDFVEELFVEAVSEHWMDQIIAPLKNIWRFEAAPEVLDKRLRHWLKLVWKSEDLPNTGELKHGSHFLPIARSRNQLTLSNVALSIVSEKPDDSFLPDLAIAWRTDSLSTQRHRWQNQTASQEQVQDIPCKDLDNNLGPMLRWRYTESIKPKLEALKRETVGDEVLLAGLDWMISALDRFGWEFGPTSAQHLREGRPLFFGTPEENKSRGADCPEVAARDELPPLNANDRLIITQKIEEAFVSPQLGQDRWATAPGMDLDYYLAWFAKFNPGRLSEIGALFRLLALSKREVGLALDRANDLPYAPNVVPPTKLLEAAKKLSRDQSPNSSHRFEWSLLEANVMAFTCFGETELKDWLVFCSGHKVTRAQIHFYPIPILSRYLLSENVVAFVRDKTKRCSDEPPDESDNLESEFDFWAALGGTAGKPNLEYHRWVDAQIRDRAPDGSRRFYWRLLWFRSAPEDLLQKAVADGSILSFLSDDGLRGMIFAHRWVSKWKNLNVAFKQLVEKIPIDEVGTLLMAANRSDDFTRWGQVMFSEALNRVGQPPFERRFWGRTILTRDQSGRITGSNCDRELLVDAASESEALRPPKQDSVSEHFSQFFLEDRNREANAAIRIWREDLDDLRMVDHGAFAQFNASRQLEAWRDKHPNDFREHARELLQRATLRPFDAFHLGGFISAVLDALVPIEPDLALQVDMRLRESSLRVNVINDYGYSTFTAALWRSAASGNQRSIELCRQLLQESSTDEELASHAIIAQAEGALEAMLSICDQLLACPLARDRALAVSLLAWVPNNAQINCLGALAENEASGWIRTHASWATEVARHEQSVRNYYHATLKVRERNAVLARLQVLLPALTLSARSWHREIEEKELGELDIPPETEAALATFWYNFRNRSKKAPKIFNRDLKEYLRGECIRDLRSPKPRLI